MKRTNNGDVKVSKDVLTKYFAKKRTRAELLFSKIWAKIHLILFCPFCNQNKRNTRDIFKEGECFWYKNWKNGNYDIPLWMGFSEWRRIRKELRKDRKLQVNDKNKKLF